MSRKVISNDGGLQKRTNVSLSDRYRDVALSVGNGNVSQGIRTALDCCTELTVGHGGDVVGMAKAVIANSLHIIDNDASSLHNCTICRYCQGALRGVGEFKHNNGCVVFTARGIIAKHEIGG